jgi:hypothetical protein
MILMKNGGTRIADDTEKPSGVDVDTNVAAVVEYMKAGEYIELFVFQNSGGALNALTGGTGLPSLSLARIG